MTPLIPIYTKSAPRILKIQVALALDCGIAGSVSVFDNEVDTGVDFALVAGPVAPHPHVAEHGFVGAVATKERCHESFESIANFFGVG